ncbi:hypothetical protein DL96DRAFT_314786 [Flagelloscypha sp. PMI_526]|nr:hypothetical protein DL96DRAFT_314786 [Flagelloscypha sp. PMI_526]
MFCQVLEPSIIFWNVPSPSFTFSYLHHLLVAIQGCATRTFLYILLPSCGCTYLTYIRSPDMRVFPHFSLFCAQAPPLNSTRLWALVLTKQPLYCLCLPAASLSFLDLLFSHLYSLSLSLLSPCLQRFLFSPRTLPSPPGSPMPRLISEPRRSTLLVSRLMLILIPRRRLLATSGGMLGPEAQDLVKKHEDDPKAMWDALPELFAPQKAGARVSPLSHQQSLCCYEEAQGVQVSYFLLGGC